MKSVVECVPNFSEGRNRATIDAIAAAIEVVPGVRLLNVEPDKDYNRTVVTFAGMPEATAEAAFSATRVALDLIDMSLHKGEHPRMGAVDVVPFVPVSGVTMEDCAGLAKGYGERAGRELKVPVYLYEYAASSPARRNLADIRKGEYEGLAEKLKDPQWKPDYGICEFVPRSGAIITGARKFLIAYNVNLKTADVAVAKEIAERIRESGRIRRDAEGNPLKDAQGRNLRIAGTLRAVKAMGVFLERFQMAQVSINLTDYETTPLHAVFEEVKRQAASLDVATDGSEIIGLTPRECLLAAGRFYGTGFPPGEKEWVQLAVERLGLSRLDVFDPQKKVIEYQLQG